MHYHEGVKLHVALNAIRPLNNKADDLLTVLSPRAVPNICFVFALAPNNGQRVYPYSEFE